MGDLLRYYAKWNKQVTENNTVWIYFHEVPRVVTFIKTESRMIVGKVWGWKGKDGELVFMGTAFQLYKMKRILEMVSGDAAQQCECI